MLATRSPQAAYRLVDFDARVAGADPRALLALCFEQFIAALDSALYAAARADNRMKSRALTRALAALTALELGVNQAEPIAPALLQLYRAARAALLGSAVQFDPAKLDAIRSDFIEIDLAMQRAGLRER